MPPANKRRKLVAGQVDELTFDPAARQEFLSGFHKRKQARIQHARDQAVQREREERVKERREIREQRKEELVQHVQAVNAELKKQNRIVNGDSDEHPSDNEDDPGEEGWDGIQDKGVTEAEPLEQEAEYVDEDKYTTVTVEAMGATDSDRASESEDAAGKGEEGHTHASTVTNGKKPRWPRPKSTSNGGANPKVKRKKFRYESKAERAATRQKQKSKNKIAKARREGA